MLRFSVVRLITGPLVHSTPEALSSTVDLEIIGVVLNFAAFAVAKLSWGCRKMDAMV